MPTRREFMQQAMAVGTGAALAGSVPWLWASPAGAVTPGGYGALVADPLSRLELPSGFTYKVIGVSNSANGVTGLVRDLLDGGSIPFPDKADGAGAFLVGANTVLVQNHEITGTPSGAGSVPKTTGAPVYDAAGAAFGGTTNMVLDSDANVLQRYVSLAGTAQNCAGGVTPWGSWLTCEETESTISGTKHGYVFEVDPAGTATTGAPLTAMGRFAHEAVAVDPATKFAYLTEDASSPSGLFFRFRPTNTSGTFNSYAAGGTLEAMACTAGNGDFINDLSQITVVGTVLNVTWVPVPQPDFTTVSVRKQFPYPGAPTGTGGPLTTQKVTRAKKYEGCWWGDGTVWINSSFTKPADLPASVDVPARPPVAHDGTVWRFDPAGQTLTLFYRSPLRATSSSDPIYTTPGTFDGPDNIVWSPGGGAFLCEDGDGLNYILALDATGAPFPFARNALPATAPSVANEEFAGACFSPDGKFMFVSIQTPAITFAISGPFDPEPPPAVPEIPKALLLPASGLAVMGGLVAWRRRQAELVDSPLTP